MLPDCPKEPAAKRATRMWRNKEISERFKKMKATGENAEQFPFGDGKKYFSTEIPKPPKNEPPQPVEIIENDAQLKGPIRNFENRFKREIKAMLEGHKERNVMFYAAMIQHQRRRLMLEKIKRLEASIAQREGGSNG